MPRRCSPRLTRGFDATNLGPTNVVPRHALRGVIEAFDTRASTKMADYAQLAECFDRCGSHGADCLGENAALHTHVADNLDAALCRR